MNEKYLLNNRYQLEEPLGSGGMAVVYQARDLMLERRVAIKILRQKYSLDPDFRESFRQELSQQRSSPTRILLQYTILP